ncbi:MAG: M20/M25/M40 family metallo-hydrolase, partial [Planctomycetia bacterium]|nr:M20/M25/M40 family metallo-hydrolase [Planctomycetia bacterium]
MGQTDLMAYLESNARRFESDLMELLRIPTISADSGHREDMKRGADWIATLLTKIGLPRVEILPTCGVAPVVYAESPHVPDAPTVLVYGHYDVQPVDPIDAWNRPPFEPAIENGRMYGRGTSDDKGQFITHVFSTEAWMKTIGRPPVNLKFCLEGEEETSSRGLEELLEREPQRFACDAMAVSDMEQFAPGRPALTCGLRGISYCEIELTGPDHDLHSGTFGGAVTNPANTLTRILADMVDAHGRIQIPGFYDQVVELTTDERALLAEMPFDEKTFFGDIGVSGGIGEVGYSPLERRWIRPTCDINGLWSGFQGE